MSKWSDKVKKALQQPRILRGIAALAGAWMEEHIDGNYGRGKGGAVVTHAPLKTVKGRSWRSSRPKDGSALAVRRTVVEKDGKTRTRTVYLIEQTSYRAGGQPLVDTGKLIGSLGASASSTGNSIKLTMHGRKYGLYQDRGFTTKGPNYIPLTMKGRRQHATGRNPNEEGLTRGRDYIVTGSRRKPKGVTVPARPFILPTRDDLRRLGKDIHLGLRAILKGK
jgi:phage gpG-like protein